MFILTCYINELILYHILYSPNDYLRKNDQTASSFPQSQPCVGFFHKSRNICVTQSSVFLFELLQLLNMQLFKAF